MDERFTAFIEKYGLSVEAARTLETLVGAEYPRPSSLVTTLVDGPPVELPTDGVDEGSGYSFFGADDTEGLDADAPTESHAVLPVGGGPRYEDLGVLGVGGMGEVRRVRDCELNRVMAMKIIRAELTTVSSTLARFVEEAQLTAQLQHPNVLPVHEIGQLDDGRVYFTMQEVRGRTLSEVIAEVHRARTDTWQTSPSGWSLRKLVATFLQVCTTLAYAHSKGVLHRDLKPSNVMVGRFAEVLVLDWGLGKVLGRQDLALEQGDLETVVTHRSLGAEQTRVGTVAGTPAYMPPEQAMGRVASLDARADVYALGAMLYEILTGRPPYIGNDAHDVLRQVVSDAPLPPTDAPAELVAICIHAMARHPSERHGSALELAADVEAWLDGSKRREKALAYVRRSLEMVPEIAELGRTATALRSRARQILAPMPPFAPESVKAAGWDLEDEATGLEANAARLDLERLHLLDVALEVAPDLVEAHAALAAENRERHAAAEASGDAFAAERWAFQLQRHVDALPTQHPDYAPHVLYLAGTGSLSLRTEPPEAEITLFRHVTVRRRRVLEEVGPLGRAPLVGHPLAMGSYVCKIRVPGRPEVVYPVFIARGTRWTASVEIPEHMPGGTVYVPAGWVDTGGDSAAVDALPQQRVWCDGFFMHRQPVTNRDYIQFLDDLVMQGREAEAIRYAPQHPPPAGESLGAPIYGRDARGFFVLVEEEGGFQPDWPVVQVDWDGANAYLAWLSQKTGCAWRLPFELEWEKAARGVDGRLYPWGDVLDASWCCMDKSHQSAWSPAPVDAYPTDVSVYGVRGLGGNVRDWCADAWSVEGPATRDGTVLVEPRPEAVFRTVRGGSWASSARVARVTSRFKDHPQGRKSNFGFRGVVAFPSSGGNRD